MAEASQGTAVTATNSTATHSTTSATAGPTSGPGEGTVGSDSGLGTDSTTGDDSVNPCPGYPAHICSQGNRI